MNKTVDFKFYICFFMLILAVSSFAQNKKNVLFIMIDDFNHWLPEISYYKQALTPNISTLASEGVLFNDAHCSSPVCNPSRNAIFSGLRPSTTNITKNGNNPDGDYVRDVPDFKDIVTMNQYFTENGYYTFAGGKLYHPGSMGGYDTDPDNWSELTTQSTGSPGGNDYAWGHQDAVVSWSAGARHVSLFVTPKQGTSFQKRIQTDSQSTHTTPQNSIAAPCWLKLIRDGNMISGWSSKDALNWSLIGRETLALSPFALAGMAVTSHDPEIKTTAHFTDYSIGVLSAVQEPVLTNEYVLYDNYPNPFNPETLISFSLPKNNQTFSVSLIIYDVTGRKVKSLIDAEKTGGYHAVRWDGTNANGQAVAAGVYIYKLHTRDFQQTRKMLLVP